jgi:peptidase U32
MPIIIRNNYNRLIKNNLPTILGKYKIKGFVLSNIGNFELLKDYKDYEFICNYTFNIFNNLTINELPANTITLSPELNKTDLKNFNTNKKTELIVYGRTPLMNSNYCLLGKSNKCYSECDHKCNSTNKYYLKDRLGFLFRIIPDNIQTITTIYNSKITSIEYDGLPIDFARIDILDENISEINDIIKTVLTGKKLEGNQYTNGNFNKEI